MFNMGFGEKDCLGNCSTWRRPWLDFTQSAWHKTWTTSLGKDFVLQIPFIVKVSEMLAGLCFNDLPDLLSVLRSSKSSTRDLRKRLLDWRDAINIVRAVLSLREHCPPNVHLCKMCCTVCVLEYWPREWLRMLPSEEHLQLFSLDIREANVKICQHISWDLLNDDHFIKYYDNSTDNEVAYFVIATELNISCQSLHGTSFVQIVNQHVTLSN